jgi:hypothetical protein
MFVSVLLFIFTDADSKKSSAPVSGSAPQVRSWKAVQGMRVNGDDVSLSEGIKVCVHVFMCDCGCVLVC